ncbi:hypothetical protein ES319_A11G142100v1 [Gossypium barbadense]|uniref:Rab-GAP TBC domain-containing protein n=1 Tax=Gossypium barbadense TaxID=3634 RepID=A0A5J5TS42_GOSBA|nr:hypothetical protein ES319_A11G142100v1 [Gossypium barbadense]KAB2056999.1 hypothetical protein ES319_A11G142100v1 [Gossypium barbadense]
MFGKKAGTEELEAFYPIRPECVAEIPKTRFKPRAGKTLSARRWQAAFSETGCLDIAKVLRRIQRGGIHPSIKGLVWEFLLGCYNPNSTLEDRNQLRQQRRERYSMWKTECRNMVSVIGRGNFITTPIITDDGQPIEVEGCRVTSAVSDKKVAQWMLILHQFGLDVVRTDRALAFYEDKANQAKLWDVLSIYSWVDDDIGYVQGMNDICSPMRENFRCSTTSIGVQSQLGTLSQVIKTVDPQLHKHLEDLDGGEYLFAFRMLMVLFRREFSFLDALYLWEVRGKIPFISSKSDVMWAMEYNPNIFWSYEQPDGASDSNYGQLNQKMLKQYGKFQRKNLETGYADKNNALAVFLVASVLETKNKQILKEAKGLDEILGDITGNLDAKKACQEALKLQNKYLKKAKRP